MVLGFDILFQTWMKIKLKLIYLFTFLFQQIIGVEFVYFNQTNSLNRRDRTLSITAYNESFSSRVEVKEHCYYSVSSTTDSKIK